MDLKELEQLRARAQSVWAHTHDPYVEELAAVLHYLLDGLAEERAHKPADVAALKQGEMT